MLVYSETVDKFIQDVRSNSIAQIIDSEVARKLNRNSARNEFISWENSLRYMFQVLVDPAIPASAKVAIEYNIPLTNRRVDFILTGKDAERKDSAVIIELKQWQDAQTTTKDAIVKTFLGGALRETNHPSYQAWSYAALIEEYNETVRSEMISLQPCAYLHNMQDGSAINDPLYNDHTDKAPVFISPDALKLAEFLKKHIKYGDSDDIMYRIEHGRIKPSKNLADCLLSMLDGNQEFLMIDEQKQVYETAIDLCHKADSDNKKTLIIKGGPGTGKSVVAINLLVEFTKRQLLTQYVSKNAAPREVFKKMLSGSRKKTHIDNLFKGSGSYIDCEPNFFDALIIDEAHRLNEKSGLYGNLGENQIKELISCSAFNLFFIDEAQRVTLKDIGTIGEIKKWAKHLNSEVFELELASQFRCNGSDGYLAWTDNALQIRETANTSLDGIDYDVQVFDDPDQLRSKIVQLNHQTNKARMVAGYCWDWASKKDASAMDIIIPEFGFEAQWNLQDDGSLWLIAENSVEQIGCIHTCQGLELDYIGVIIGDDLIVRDGNIITDATKRSRQDRSVLGIKKLLKQDPDSAKQQADSIIKNTYRTLMTRGQKGCLIFSTDKETREYFKQLATREQLFKTAQESTPYPGLELEVVDSETADQFIEHVPVFNIEVAAGGFSDVQSGESSDWVKVPDHIRIKPGMFVTRVVGESMNKKIPNGSWCLFSVTPGGSKNGRILLVQHHTIEDPDNGGCYTVKKYQSEKTLDNDTPITTKIRLKPDTTAFNYKDIVIEDDENLSVIGEFLCVL